MSTRPRTRYAYVGDDAVAYQVVGDGPVDLVYVFGFEGHVEAQWDYPKLASFLERLASFSRLILFNRRGHGMSDPIDLDNITLEQWMDDVNAVLDAVGSETAVLVGGTEGSPMAILYAATYPDRTTALVLGNAYATVRRRPDYPHGVPHSVQQAMIDGLAARRDDRPLLEWFGLGTSDHSDVAHTARLFRYATSPGMMLRFMKHTSEIDVRHVLPLVRVPTLVLHRKDLDFVRPAHGRYLAEHIDNAKYVELDGHEFFLWWGDMDSVVDEIEEFVTGVRPIAEPDRVLATVLFADVVSSTEHASEIGDKRWRQTLGRLEAVVRGELERGRGRYVKNTGDGFLATFDGPARAVKCSIAVVEAAKDMNIDLRAGVHTGEIEVVGEDIAGIAVHIGSRVQDLAGPGEVLVSRTVVDLVAGSGLAFVERGSHSLRGVPGEWQLYAVEH